MSDLFDLAVDDIAVADAWFDDEFDESYTDGTVLLVDPADTDLDGLWLDGFTASPWVGSASLGASGDNDLSEATNPPGTSSALNGHVGTDYDGVLKRINTGAYYANTLLGDYQYYFGVVCKPRTAPATLGLVYDPLVFGDPNVNFGLAYSDAGFRAFQYDTTTGYVQIEVAAPVDEVYFVEVWHDGTHLHLAVDGVEGTPVACPMTWVATYLSVLPCQLGYNTFSSTEGMTDICFDGEVWAVLTRRGPVDGTKRDGFRAYFSDRYLPAPAAYTLTTVVGAFVLTGNAAGLYAQRKLVASAGSLALTGSAADLEKQSRMPTTVGAFAITGNDASLERGLLITSSAGVFILTGNASSLSKQSRLTTSAATFAITGNDASLERNLLIAAGVAAFAVTGNAAGLTKQSRLTASAAAFILTGNDVGLKRSLFITAGTGVFLLTANDAALLTTRRLDTSVGTFAISGGDVSLERGLFIAAAAGAFIFTGNDAGLSAQRKLAAELGVFILTGNAANFTVETPGQTVMPTSAGAFVISGSAAGLLTARMLATTTGAFSVVGSDAGLRAQRRVTADLGTFSIVGSDAGLRTSRSMLADPGAFAISGSAVGLRKSNRLAAERGEFLVAGNAAGLVFYSPGPTLYVVAGSFVITGGVVFFTREWVLKVNERGRVVGSVFRLSSVDESYHRPVVIETNEPVVVSESRPTRNVTDTSRRGRIL